MKKLFFLFVFTFSLSITNGQDCQTPDGGFYYNNNYEGSYTGLKTTPILVKLYIWRTNDGSGFTSEALTQHAIENLNLYYNAINIYFDICVDEYDGTPGLLAYNTNSYDDGLNLYLAHYWAGGFAQSNGGLNCWANPYTTSPSHEVGHCLGLFHTFSDGVCPADADSELAPTLDAMGEYVNSPNCNTHGDLICDTPAEPAGLGSSDCYPYLSNCQFQNPAPQYLDFAGNPYIDPNNVLARNIMSYNGCRDQFTDGQNVRMRDMIAGAPILSNIERTYQSGVIYSSKYTYLNNTITVSEVWDENTSFNYDVTVAEGVTLTITADIKFTAGHGLHVKKGGQLIIDGGKLDLDVIRESCVSNGMVNWKGISIETDENVQTVLEMYNDAEINNADVALNIENQGQIFFYVNNAKFMNNRISVLASNNTFATPFIRNTEFSLDQNYLPSSEYGQITLENCNRIYFGTCKFLKTSSNALLGSGITSFNTGVTCVNCEYAGWHRGVNILSASDKTAYFSLGDFHDNNIGIWNSNFNNSLIKKSEFKVFNTQYGNDHIGIRASNARGTRIFDNEFYGQSGTEDKIGVSSANFFFNILYNNNTFEDLDIAYDSEACGTSQVGLVHECNVFKNNEKDFYAEFGLKNHGSDANSIGNKFSHNNNGDPGSDFTISDFGFVFRYFHEDGNSEETPMFTSGFGALGIDDQSDCNYPSIVNDPPTTGTLTPFHVKHTEFTNGINTTNNHIDTNADSGDTDGLVQVVNSDSPINSIQVYNSLMTISPWISTNVGQAIISNSQYYTESQLVSLFVSNSYWLQDEVLYAFVNGPSSPLGSTSVSYINANSSPVDAQSQAFFHLSDLMHGRDVNITNAINFINTVDDGTVNYNDLRTWFDMMDGYHKEIAIAESYMTQHNYTSAVSHLSQKRSSTTYSISERNDINEYLNLLNTQIGVYSDKRNEWDLTSSEYSAIETIANSNHPIASAKAKDILEYYYGISFPKSTTRNSETASYEIAKESRKSLSAYPNPASNSFNIVGVEDYIGMDIQISNIYGDLIYSDKISEIKIDQNFENGLYIITVIDNGRKVASGKIIIVK